MTVKYFTIQSTGNGNYAVETKQYYGLTQIKDDSIRK